MNRLCRPRALAALLCLLILALCLGGCHGTRGLSAFSMPEQFDEGRTYEISFWAKNDTNKTQVEIYEKAIEDFEALYPNIHVTLRLYTDYGKIYNDVITNIATGTTPNVCISYPDHIATYLTGTNIVVPLDELMADAGYGLGGDALKFDSPSQAEMVEQFLQEGNFDGRQYALPFMRSTEACYINQDMVEALGYTLPDVLTWDFMFEVAEAAMEKDAEGNFVINGQKVLIPIIYKSTDNMMIQMLYQKGAPYATEEGEVALFNETTGQLLMEIARHAETRAFSTFKISSYPANFLNAGQCIFAIDSTAGATWMGSDAPLSDISEDKIVTFETAVRPVPQFDPEDPKMISQGPSVCIFNKDDPQEVLASWLFAQYLLTDAVQIAYAQTEGYVPVSLKAQQSEAYQAYLAQGGADNELHYDVKIQATQLLLAHMEDTFVTPVFNGSASLRDAAGELVENVTKSVRRQQTVDQAYLESLYEEVRALYHLDQLDTQTASGPGMEDLGPLPGPSVALLIVLGATWLLMLGWVVVRRIRRGTQNK